MKSLTKRDIRKTSVLYSDSHSLRPAHEVHVSWVVDADPPRGLTSDFSFGALYGTSDVFRVSVLFSSLFMHIFTYSGPMAIRGLRVHMCAVALYPRLFGRQNDALEDIIAPSGDFGAPSSSQHLKSALYVARMAATSSNELLMIVSQSWSCMF